MLYDQGFTISGARNRLADAALSIKAAAPPLNESELDGHGSIIESAVAMLLMHPDADRADVPVPQSAGASSDPRIDAQQLRKELLSIRELLSV